MVPSHYRQLFTHEQIQTEVQRLGVEISQWAVDEAKVTGQDILAVPVLRGGIYFFADLTRKISCSLELAPMRTRAYVDAANNVERDKVEINTGGVEYKGRSVLLVDDICDSGRTMQQLSRHLLETGAHSVRAAVLVHRVHEACVYKPQWAAFEYEGPEWFVGYGMEDRNRWMNLDSIYIIENN